MKALTDFTLATVANCETKIVDHLGEHGPTAFYLLHRLCAEPMSYVQRAVLALVSRDVARWSREGEKLRADAILELVRTGPIQRVWCNLNGWRNVP